jgi:hypothetical protein
MMKAPFFHKQCVALHIFSQSTAVKKHFTPYIQKEAKQCNLK